MSGSQARALRLGLILACALGASSASALALPWQTCPAPYVTVNFKPDVALVSQSRSIQELSVDRQDNQPEGDGHTLGNYTARVSVAIESRLRRSKSWIANTLCTREAAVTIELEHSIALARELPRGSCAYREALAHEREHERRQIAAIRSQIPALEQTIKAMLSPISGGSAAQQDTRHAALVDAITLKATSNIDRSSKKSQSEFDSPEEYLRFSQSCGEEIPALVRELHQ